MKRLLTIFVVIAIVFYSTFAWAPPGGADVQIRDRNSQNKADVTQTSITMIADIFGLVTMSIGYFWDGTVPRRIVGDALDTDDIASTTEVPYHGVFLHYLDQTNTDWDRVRGDAAGDSISSTQTGMFTLPLNLFYDGTNYRRWQGTTAAHNLTLPVAPHVLATMMAYDGATLDMLLTGATGELLTTDVATRPGEDAGNDWRKTKKEAIAVYTPPKTAGTAVAAAAVEVLGSAEIMGYPNVCIWLENAGGGGAGQLTDADIQVSPDGTMWVSVTSTVCDAITSGNGCVQCFTNSAYRYVQVYATAAAPANDTTVNAWVTANTN